MYDQAMSAGATAIRTNPNDQMNNALNRLSRIGPRIHSLCEMATMSPQCPNKAGEDYPQRSLAQIINEGPTEINRSLDAFDEAVHRLEGILFGN